MLEFKELIYKLPMKRTCTNNSCIDNCIKIFINRNYYIVLINCFFEKIARLHSH